MTRADSRADSGAIVVGWMTKLFVTVAVLGFLGYDAVSILTTSISTSDRANTLANQAADDVKSMKSVDGAYAVILKQAQDSGDTLRPQDFRVAPNGEVTLILHHKANSLWMIKVSSLKKYLDIKETGTGNPAS